MTETTSIAGRVYRVAELRPIVAKLPTIQVAIEQLTPAVGPGHTYWIDRAGKHIGPHDLLTDWSAAKRNPDWADHVATIERADLADPIWVYEDGSVIDGVHRLTRAIRDRVSQLSVKQIQARDLVDIPVFQPIEPIGMILRPNKEGYFENQSYRQFRGGFGSLVRL